VLVDPPRGARGFGYDPAFLSDDLGVTFGEADDALKDTVSHRAKALRLLLDTGVFDLL
jgi:XTP/dITP diphosphohydrolase